MFTDKINLALKIAAKVHQGQNRKGTDIPYISHPVAVGMIINQYTNDETTIVAGILHDILEDVNPGIYSEADMRRDFGDEITDIVKDVSEPKTAGQPKLLWKERKKSYLKRLGSSYYIETYFVVAADKIHNLTDILKDYDQFGNEIWHRFNASKWDILQYHRAVFNLIRKEPIPIELKRHLAALIEELGDIVTINPYGKNFS